MAAGWKARATRNMEWKAPEQIFQLPCECRTCTEQYYIVPGQKQRVEFRYTGELSVSAVAALSRTFCTSIFEDLQAIRLKVYSHGSIIQKRWKKKSNTKRKAFLKRLRPNMYDNEDAFLDVVLHECENPIAARKYRTVCLLPYISVDTLSKDSSRLLRLLHYRASHLPDEWVTFDNRQIIAGWAEGVLEQQFNSGCICMYGKSYGQWRPFSEVDGRLQPRTSPSVPQPLPSRIYLPRYKRPLCMAC